MTNRHYADPTRNEPTPSSIECYRNDPKGPTPQEEHGSVEVNDITNLLDENVFEGISQLIDPLSTSDSFGIDLYMRAVESLG